MFEELDLKIGSDKSNAKGQPNISYTYGIVCSRNCCGTGGPHDCC